MITAVPRQKQFFIPVIILLLTLPIVASITRADTHAQQSALVADPPPLVALVWPQEKEKAPRISPLDNLRELRNTILADSIQLILTRYSDALDRTEQLELADLLLSEAKRNRLDPLYLAALIKIESAFYTQAVSNMGARGLMQMMPATGIEMARELNMTWLGPNMLHKPALNVRLGAYYLARLLTHYHGDYRLALTAYNRGPRNVRILMRKSGKLDDEYTEYYQKIQETYEDYKRSLGVRTALLNLG